jgi:transcriptional regulator with XRE-family HTH domain
MFVRMSNIRKVVGKNIQFYRKKRKLTQLDLAIEINMEPLTISRIELGKVSARLETLEKIAKALNVEIGKFFLLQKKRL